MTELEELHKDFNENGLNMKYKLALNFAKVLGRNYVYLYEMTPDLIDSEIRYLNQIISVSKVPIGSLDVYHFKLKLLTNLELYKRKFKIEKIWKNTN